MFIDPVHEYWLQVFPDSGLALIDGKAEVRGGESRSFGRLLPVALKKAGKSFNIIFMLKTDKNEKFTANPEVMFNTNKRRVGKLNWICSVLQ